MIGMNGPVTGQHYAWSQEAFAKRCMTLLDSRNLKSVAEVTAALNSMAFNAAGWTTLKRILAELVCGSVAFGSELSADGSVLTGGLTELTLATRDVSSGVT